MRLAQRACPRCGRLPRYYGRRELLRFLAALESRLRAPCDVNALRHDVRNVLNEAEYHCTACLPLE